jgi:ankyrin repeat protein
MTGVTTLFDAARLGHTAMVQHLVVQDSSCVDAADQDGRTALYHAALAGQVDTVKLLVGEGANIDAFTNGGWSPLYGAAFEGYLDIVELLISEGASTVLQDGTPMADAANQMGHTATAMCLMEATRVVTDNGAGAVVHNDETVTTKPMGTPKKKRSSGTKNNRGKKGPSGRKNSRKSTSGSDSRKQRSSSEIRESPVALAEEATAMARPRSKSMGSYLSATVDTGASDGGSSALEPEKGPS